MFRCRKFTCEDNKDISPKYWHKSPAAKTMLCIKQLSLAWRQVYQDDMKKEVKSNKSNFSVYLKCPFSFCLYLQSYANILFKTIYFIFWHQILNNLKSFFIIQMSVLTAISQKLPNQMKSNENPRTKGKIINQSRAKLLTRAGQC